MRLWCDWPGFSGDEISEEFYQQAIAAILDWDGISDRERLLFEFADCFERDIESVNGKDQLCVTMYAHLTEAEIRDLVIMLATSRALKALGIGSVCVISRTQEPDAKLRNHQLQFQRPLAAAE